MVHMLPLRNCSCTVYSIYLGEDWPYAWEHPGAVTSIFPKKDTGKRKEITENCNGSLVWLTSSLNETRAIKQSNPKVVRNAGENLRNISAKSSKMFENWRGCSNSSASRYKSIFWTVIQTDYTVMSSIKSVKRDVSSKGGRAIQTRKQIIK